MIQLNGRYFRNLFLPGLLGLLAACGGGGGGDGGGGPGGPVTYTVSASAGANGSISPGSAAVNSGATTAFTVTPDTGYAIDSVAGCGGTLSGNTYTTGAVTANCTVTASFVILTYTVTATAGANGAIDPANATVDHGSTTTFTVTPEAGFAIDSVTGCGGALAGNTYTTGPVTASCTVAATFGFANAPASAAAATFEINAVKSFRVTWTDVADATFYRLLENPDGASGFTQVGVDIPAGTETYDHVVPLYARFNATYILQSCNNAGCTDATAVGPSGTLEDAIGYFKASSSDADDEFGRLTSLSADGRTLAVGAYREDSAATTINGDDTDNSVSQTGAAYVFVRDDAGMWTQQAYLKASNAELGDSLGWSVSLSGDGNTLAVGAFFEGSNATGVGGDMSNNDADNSGAVYIFSRSGTDWSETAYIKASNTERDDNFGESVALNGDGTILAVGAEREDSAAGGIDGNQADNTAMTSGAVYVFGMVGGTWTQQAYVKPSSTDAEDLFSRRSIALSADGSTLAVGATGEDSSASGIDGDATDNTLESAGAVYVYTGNAGTWTQEAYIKASNPDFADGFGSSVDLSGDGSVLIVGANFEDSAASGVGGDQADNSANNAGAAYVFERSAGAWAQTTYLKPSNMSEDDLFGAKVAISDDGNRIVVGAPLEDSDSLGINGLQSDVANFNSGAAYYFERSGGTWQEIAFIKPSALHQAEFFGGNVSLSGDGETLATGVYREDGGASGVGGDENDNSAPDSGAVFVF